MTCGEPQAGANWGATKFTCFLIHEDCGKGREEAGMKERKVVFKN